MSYNDGEVHLDFFESEDELEKIAKDFSEGDPLLETTLLELWKNGIKTQACCKGHSETEQPYISLIFDMNSYDFVKKISDLAYSNLNIRLRFNHNYKELLSNGKGYDVVSIYMENEQCKEKVLNFIRQSLNQNIETFDSRNLIPRYAKLLLSIAKRQNLECEFVVENGTMYFAFAEQREISNIFRFKEDAPHLDELIDLEGQTVSIPFGTIMCDEKSLQKFINIIYPDTFEIENEEKQI